MLRRLHYKSLCIVFKDIGILIYRLDIIKNLIIKSHTITYVKTFLLRYQRNANKIYLKYKDLEVILIQ